MDTTTTQEAAERLHVPVAMQDGMSFVEDLIGAMQVGRAPTDMPPAIAQLWHAAHHLANEHPNTSERHTFPVRAAHVLALNALIASPEAVLAALERLRAELVRLDPTLAPIA